MTPDDGDTETLETCLRELRRAIRKGRLPYVVLHFRDGIRAEVKRSHAMRFWRRNDALLE